MENNSGAFRKKKTYFSQVSNAALRDETLSLKAKGLYALIQSYITLENFVLYKNTLRKNCHEGKTSFENAWNELKKAGYLKQHQYKNKKGCFVYEYELLDKKEKTHTPENQGMDNLPTGKGGAYSNTDSNNTEINNNLIKGIIISMNNSQMFLEECLEAINYYFSQYEQYVGKQHPVLSKEHWETVIMSLFTVELNGLFTDVSLDDEMTMIDKYFATNFDTDRNILHYVSGNIRALRCYEECY